MAQPYFKQIPNIEYVSRLKNAKNISDYIQVKNLFRRAKIASSVFSEATNFTKYKIIGDERPDNVAFKLYNDQYLDWLVLLANNIVNVEDEWPLSQYSFDKYLLSKYKTQDKIHAVHHYESQEVRDSENHIIGPKGYEVPSDFSITYYDIGLGSEKVATNITDEISNYEYEERKQTAKRNILVLKGRYLGRVVADLESIMPYKKGSTQYVSPNLVRAENIRLYN